MATQCSDDTSTLYATARDCLAWLSQGNYRRVLDQASDILAQRIHYLGDPALLATSPSSAAQLDSLFQWQNDDAFAHLRRTPLPPTNSGFPFFKRVDPSTLLAAIAFAQTPSSTYAVVLIREEEAWKYHNLCQFGHDMQAPQEGWCPIVAEAEAAFSRLIVAPTTINDLDEASEDDAADDDDDYWNQYESKAATPAPRSSKLARDPSSNCLSAAEDSYWAQYDTKSPAPEPPSSKPTPAVESLSIEDASFPDTASTEPLLLESQDRSLPPRVITSALTLNPDAVSPIELFNRLKTLSESEDELDRHAVSGPERDTPSSTSDLDPADSPSLNSQLASSTTQGNACTSQPHSEHILSALQSLHALSRSLGLSSDAFVQLAKEAAKSLP
ncbi:hypothetical protein H4R33_001906 [Dimargaris cristalligena]|nr:hypothetical protein H4R33_001906 [Dimargaris cristalligena]